jgi:hypothetical protein
MVLNILSNRQKKPSNRWVYRHKALADSALGDQDPSKPISSCFDWASAQAGIKESVYKRETLN